MQHNYTIPATILSVSLIICALIFTITWSNNYKSAQTITVTGSANQELVSDLGILRGTLNSNGRTSVEAFNRLEEQKPALLKFFEDKGFPASEVTFSTMNSYSREEYTDNGRPTGRILSVNYSQRIEITSQDVHKIRDISLELASLIQQGVEFNVENPEYHYTDLDEIRINIQAEAARNAMARAEMIANATGRKLGPLSNSRMGVIQITPLNSNMVSDYGYNDLSSIDKKITGVVSATFRIY